MEKFINFINGIFNIFWGITRPFLKNVFEIMDEGKILKRFAVLSGIALTVYCAFWSFDFAVTAPERYSGSDVGLIIGAVMSPVAILTGALMKYGDDLYEMFKQPSNNNPK